jgi:hypothetical protein
MNKTLQSLVNGIIHADQVSKHDEVDVMLNYCMFNLTAPDKKEIDTLRFICNDVRVTGDNWTQAEWEHRFNTMRVEVLPIAIIKYLVSVKGIEIQSEKIPSRTIKAFRNRYGFLFEEMLDTDD